MNIKEGQPFNALITDIKPAWQLGVEGNSPVAVVKRDGETGVGWYPLEAEHEFNPGDHVIITSQTRYHQNGAPLTTYRLEPIQK